MKIFTKAEVVARKNAELGREARDAMELASLVDSESKELVRIREEKEAFLKDFAERLKAETSGLEAKRDELANAVHSLEERRRAALAPVEPIIAGAEKREAAVKEREEAVTGREAKAEARASELAEIAITLEERKDAILAESAVLDTRRAGIEAEASSLLTMQQAFSERQQEFKGIFERHLVREAEWETRRTNEKAALDAEREQLGEEKEAIRKDRAHLRAQQETLSQAFDEARSKNIL